VTVFALDHPVAQHKVALLRDRSTDLRTFRSLVREISLLVAYEATRDLPTEEWEVETPLERTPGVRIAGSRLAVVPVLRAGLGMLDAVLSLLPTAPVGFVGLQRDHDTLRPEPDYLKLPDGLAGRTVMLLDPMLATGGSASHAIAACKEAGARDGIRLLALIAAPEGIERIRREHPDAAIYTAAIDRQLNDIGYILPGLGDAGDRLYGTF
jgi:uracil phosphoribosyltransferase